MKITSLIFLTFALIGMMPLFTFGVPYEGDQANKYWKNHYKTDESLLKRMNEKMARESDTVVRVPACESQGPEIRQSATVERFTSVGCPCSCKGRKAECGEHRSGLKCKLAVDKCDRFFSFTRHCACVVTCEFA